MEREDLEMVIVALLICAIWTLAVISNGGAILSPLV